MARPMLLVKDQPCQWKSYFRILLKIWQTSYTLICGVRPRSGLRRAEVSVSFVALSCGFAALGTKSLPWTWPASPAVDHSF